MSQIRLAEPNQTVHADVGELLQRSIGSLKLAVEIFNRPNDEGRPEAVLILLHHGFELILKSVIVARTGTAYDEERGFSYSFDYCLRIVEDDFSLLNKDQRRFLSMLDNLRDCAIHYYQILSEDLIYIFAQGSITLYDQLLRIADGRSLKDCMPSRVLPLSSRPPKDLHLLVDQEFNNLKQALQDMTMSRAKAIATLRPLMAFSVGAEEFHRRMTTSDLANAIEKLEQQHDWKVVFPEIAKLRVASEGDGILVGVKIIKENPTAMPVRVLKAGDTEEPQGTVITKEVNILDKYNMGLKGLGEHIGLNQIKTKALAEFCGIYQDKEAYRVVKVGSSEYKRYSKKALDVLRENLGKCDEAWAKQKATKLQMRNAK